MYRWLILGNLGNAAKLVGLGRLDQDLSGTQLPRVLLNRFPSPRHDKGGKIGPIR
jgi:hypothetical protein